MFLTLQNTSKTKRFWCFGGFGKGLISGHVPAPFQGTFLVIILVRFGGNFLTASLGVATPGFHVKLGFELSQQLNFQFNYHVLGGLVSAHFGSILGSISGPIWAAFWFISGALLGGPSGPPFEQKHKENKWFWSFSGSPSEPFWSPFWGPFSARKRASRAPTCESFTWPILGQMLDPVSAPFLGPFGPILGRVLGQFWVPVWGRFGARLGGISAPVFDQFALCNGHFIGKKRALKRSKEDPV